MATLAVMPLAAQTRISLSSQSRNVDFSAAAFTKPLKSGIGLPSTCSVGEMYFRTDTPAGENLYGCTEINVWSRLGYGVAGQLTSLDLSDCRATAQGSSTAVNLPCRFSIGGVVHQIGNQAPATLNGTAASGTVYWYWDAQGRLTADENTAATLTCDGVCRVATTGGFPPGAFPIATAAFTNNVFDGPPVDLRTFFANKQVYCGAGLTCTQNGSTGELTIAADTATSLVSKSAYQAGQIARCSSAALTGAHTCGLTPPLLGYSTGMVVEFVSTAASVAGATTINIDGLGAKAIKKADGVTDPGESEIAAGVQVPLRYDGGVFRLPPGPGSASGPFGSLPACSAAQSGFLYLFSDSLYDSARCNGSQWSYLWDGRMVAPPAGSWNWDNQTQTGSAVLSTSHGFHELYVPATHASGYAVRYQTAPAVPYVRVFAVGLDAMLGGSAGGRGYLVGFRESATGRLHGIGIRFDPSGSRWMLNVLRARPTVTDGTDSQEPAYHLPAQLFFRIEDDGVNLKFSYSIDGFRFRDVMAVGRNTYLAGGPDQIFFAAASAGSAQASVLDVVSIQ